MNETRTLARFVAQTNFGDLPRGLVDNLKLTVLDTFAAGFVGSLQPWARRIVAVVRRTRRLFTRTGERTFRGPPSPTAP